MIYPGLPLTDYKRSLRGLDEGEDREAKKLECHLRSASKLVQLCFANGGIYIKLGQVAAQMVCPTDLGVGFPH